MRKTFQGYYRPSEKEFEQLWARCLFVPDANVLLNLYRYSDKTTDKLLQILSKLGSRLWVPHQAAFEYQKNRLAVISAQRDAYKKIEHLLEESSRRLESELNEFRRHPLIDADGLLRQIAGSYEEQKRMLAGIKQNHPDLIAEDTVRRKLTTLLDGKIGSAFQDERLKEVLHEADGRYAKSIPPGYKDQKTKDGDRAYGDVVLWYQIIEKATKEKKPIILITDDSKEDWWWKHEGKALGPRPELVEEMHSRAGVGFYMYASDQFMQYASRFLKEQIDQKAIDEVREVRHQNEDRARRHALSLLAARDEEARKLDTERFSLSREIEDVRSELAEYSRQQAEVGVLFPEEGERQLQFDRMLEQNRQRAHERLSLLMARVRDIEKRASALEQTRVALHNELRHLELPRRSEAGRTHRSREAHRLSDG